jgi:hypothetical protein
VPAIFAASPTSFNGQSIPETFKMKTFYKICLFIAGAEIVASICWLIYFLNNRSSIGHGEAPAFFITSLFFFIVQIAVNLILFLILMWAKAKKRLSEKILIFVVLALIGLIIGLVPVVLLLT